jgi:signal transduction histidine kinase
MDNLAGSSVVPLMAASVVLFVLVAFVAFAVLKFRNARPQKGPSDRLSEEAFAAAMIQSALAGRPAPPATIAATGAPLLAPAIDGADAAVIEALPVAVVATDEVGVVRRVNAAARADLGLEAAATGHPFRAVLAPWPELVDAMARVQSGGAPVATSVGGLANGPRPAHAARTASGGSRGGVVVVIGPAGAEAAAAPEDAGSWPAPGASEAVSRLAGGLAHELANSLTTIHGYAHLVNTAGLSEADRSALQQIRASGESMLATIEAFRALVRPLRLSPEPFPLDHAVQDAVSLARQEAKAGAEAVRVDAIPGRPVLGDRVVIEEAIAEVVRNAIEAHRLASVDAPVAVRVGPAAGGGVDVVIADRGPGVLPELRSRLCQPFFSDKVGHPGLGLARVCHVLRAHAGASIAFDHPASGGLVVTIHLPPAA